MDSFLSELKDVGYQGDITTDISQRELYSHDASMFELMPKVVLTPKHVDDIKKIVCLVTAKKPKTPELSLTMRSGGTDMSGGAISNSIVIDIQKNLDNIFEVDSTSARTQPGAFYRDFEEETLKHGALLPSYPASRDLCTVGGMVANNSGGEKSLEHGKTEKFVTNLRVIFSDGNEYEVRPLNKQELKKKMAQKDFEGSIYKQIFDLVDSNYEEIKSAQPKVSKDSTGYHLWNVWDKDKGIFDLTQLIVGSQGTLGIVTEITFRLVPAPKNSGTLVVFLRKIDDLGEVINKVLEHKPATFEGFDNYTLMLSFKLFFFFHKTLGWWGMIKLGVQLIPDALMLLRGIPKMVLLIEFNGETDDEVAQKVRAMHEDMKQFGHEALFEEDNTEAKAKKFWIMRRQSFNLLRQKVKDKHTAPYIDDLVVPPSTLPKFLPELRKILNKYKLLATIAGHMGDGNFHVIPLMKIEDPKEVAKIEPSMREVNELVLSYGGSLSGEHNDGMSRGPWLKQMYGKDVYQYFADVKQIFDPDNIFNPNKKTDARWEFSMSNLREHF